MFDLYLRKLAVEIEQLNNAECINLFSQKLFFKLDLATKRFCVLRSQFKSNSKEAKDLDIIIMYLYAFQLDYYLLVKTKGINIKIPKAIIPFIDKKGSPERKSVDRSILAIKTFK